jgi:cyanophycinase-like exopeptidase
MPRGPLSLVGGAELQPLNEAQDRVLVEAAAGGPAFVVPTAAARQEPQLAVENARRWFGGLGCEIHDLPVLTRRHADDPAVAERAATGRLFYLVGGDPGHLLRTLEGSAVWRAIVEAWRVGAALGGSSAGAMVLGQWVLLRAGWPNRQKRRAVEGLGVVPGVAVVPHYDGFGARWTLADPERPRSGVRGGRPHRPLGIGLDGPTGSFYEEQAPRAPAGAPLLDTREGAAARAARPSDEPVRMLGLDERTAAVWTAGDGWRTFGPGRVLLDGREFREGEAVEGLGDPW